jgi:hypothetical protein
MDSNAKAGPGNLPGAQQGTDVPQWNPDQQPVTNEAGNSIDPVPVLTPIFKSVSEIPNDTREGRYLLAAIAKITTESQTGKTPDEVLGQLTALGESMWPGQWTFDR